ncbi:MAG: pyrroline-5-carboxylate reductase [Tissierellia bacterium]|nr:pyrroline-5-carboxylate reductase [Tissierellia bacterium]
MKLGIIGFGHLAKAFAEGVLKSNKLKSEDITITSLTQKTKENALSKFKIRSYSTNKELSSNCNYIILSVKPHLYEDILTEIRNYIRPDTVIISFLAGTKLSQLEEFLPKGTQIIRVMPNIAMAVRESMSCICPNEFVGDDELSNIRQLFEEVGSVIETEEEDLEKISALSGSGLGFVAYLLESFEKASIELGLPTELKQIISSQTFAGAVSLVSNTDVEAEALKDQVATEGGSTIEGLKYLESQNVDEKIINAIRASYNRVQELSR